MRLSLRDCLSTRIREPDEALVEDTRCVLMTKAGAQPPPTLPGQSTPDPADEWPDLSTFGCRLDLKTVILNPESPETQEVLVQAIRESLLKGDRRWSEVHQVMVLPVSEFGRPNQTDLTILAIEGTLRFPERRICLLYYFPSGDGKVVQHLPKGVTP